MSYQPDAESSPSTRSSTLDPIPVESPHPKPPLPPNRNRSRNLRRAAIVLGLVVIFALAGALYARHWVRAAVVDSLPQLDGTLTIPGLQSPVIVLRDAHGVPHLRAATLDDLVLAQGFVTAQDRLFQMDTLRRHAAGTLAEVLGPRLLAHDRLQRTLLIRDAADRAIAVLPPAQLHLLEQYARGVNASITQQLPHLPFEFRVLSYTPAPWTPRDSLLVTLVMFQDLSSRYQSKLDREALTARLPPELAQDLYPVGSWRDHTPGQPFPDLTVPGPPVEQVPLDESQARLRQSTPPGAPGLASEIWGPSATEPQILAEVQHLIHPEDQPGSNAWAVSGDHTASGKPLLANDMHLSLTVPGIWYEADLQATESTFHAAGVSIPGAPLICVGHNDHIAWGFTNLGADVQDLYLETTRNAGNSEEFQAADGSWQPVTVLQELIKVDHAGDETLAIRATRHGDTLTPILPAELTNGRNVALRWVIYDPLNLHFPWLQINRARDWPTFLAATADFGGPAQNVIYADDQGHIGYHALGRIPLRGPAPLPPTNIPNDLAPDNPDAPGAPSIATAPPSGWVGSQDYPGIPKDLTAPAGPAAPQLSGPLSPVPIPPSPAHEWAGYIPFDQLPQAFDPPGGVLATANARITPDDYSYPITLNWAAPYRNERIWKQLAHAKNLTPADMLALENDVYSDFDHVLAERLAYALDHATANRNPQAADLLRTFSGRMSTDSAAATLVAAIHATLWPMLLAPHLAPGKSGAPPTEQSHRSMSGIPASTLPLDLDLDQLLSLYNWGEKDYALEQILMHTPARWLPSIYTSWDDFLAAAVARAISDNHPPSDLTKWLYGPSHTIALDDPIFAASPNLRRLYARSTGTGPRPQSGDGTTVKQTGRTTPFGPSERFTADLANLENSTLNLPMGQSANPASPWFQDQFSAWLRGTTYPFAYHHIVSAHTLTLNPAPR